MAPLPKPMSRSAPVRLAGRIACAIATLASLSVVLEGGLRLQALFDDARADRAERRVERAPRPPSGATVELMDIVRRSESPERVYELLPDLDVRFVTRVTTNAAGFRGAAVAVEKPLGTVRIVGLGDSVMFGWGLDDESSFLVQLGKRLARRHPSVRWETINAAVPGYNTVNEVATLEGAALPYRPDLVVIHFGGDDLQLPKFITRHTELRATHRSLLLELVSGERGADPSERPGALVTGAARRHGAPRSERPGDEPSMAGWGAYERSMRRLRELADREGFVVVAVAHPRFPRRVRRLLDELEILAVETEQTVARFATDHRITDVRDHRLVLSDADPHPTTLVHGLIADAIAEAMERDGVVERLVERPSRVESAP